MISELKPDRSFSLWSELKPEHALKEEVQLSDLFYLYKLLLAINDYLFSYDKYIISKKSIEGRLVYDVFLIIK